MRKIGRVSTGAVMVLLGAGAVWAADKLLERRVQVRESAVRDKPSAIGKVLATVRYGDRVEVPKGKDEAAWVEVTATAADGKPVTGWLRGSALTEKKIKLTAGDGSAKVTASGEEIAMAGKGIEQAELEYRKDHPDLEKAFGVVDRMETEPLYKVTPEQVNAFLKGGGVTPREGVK